MRAFVDVTCNRHMKEHDVKRFTTLSILVAASLLGVLAVSATAASAETTSLCKSNPLTHKCSTSDRFSKGTSIRGVLAGNLVIDSENGSHLDSCTGSEFELGAGVSGVEQGLKMEPTTKFSVSGCAETTTTYLGAPTNADVISYIAGTNDGVWAFHSEVKFGMGLWGGSPEWTCRYQLTSGKLVGGATPALVYNKSIGYTAPAGWSENSIFCFKRIVITGTYNLTPSPIYVEE
jgi:hypothetical protein